MILDLALNAAWKNLNPIVPFTDSKRKDKDF